MDEQKLTIIRGYSPDGGGIQDNIWSYTTFLFIEKYWFRKVNVWVILEIHYIVSGFNK